MASRDPPNESSVVRLFHSLRLLPPLLAVAAVVIVAAGLRAAAPVLLPVLMAAFITVLVAPAVLWLERRRVPAGLAVIVVMSGVVAVLAAVAALVTTSLQGFEDALPGYQDTFASATESIIDWATRSRLQLSHNSFLSALDPGSLFGLTGTLVQGLLAAVSNVALVVFTAMFMLLEVAGFPRKLAEAFTDSSLRLGRWTRLLREIQRYLVIKTVMSLATGATVGLWVWFVGLDFPVLWGFVAFLLNYIPNVGSIIAAIPAILLAWIQPGLGAGGALLVALGYVAVNMVVGNIVEPQLMGRRLGLSPLVVFLAVIFWGWIWGPVGMLLSVPLTMIAHIVCEQHPETRWLAVLLGPSPRMVARKQGSERRLTLRADVEPQPGATAYDPDSAAAPPEARAQPAAAETERTPIKP